MRGSHGTRTPAPLALALERLEGGDAVGFDYALWVAFGDAWPDRRLELARLGLIDAEGRFTVATDRGRAARAALLAPVRRAG